MAGHNKWSKIKNRKAVTDARKSKLFTKFARLIAVEAKLAQGNVNSPSLKAAIERAREVNMPNDNIDRAVKKGAGGEGETLDYALYEAYGPGGAAILVECLTNNRNRTAQEVKLVLSQNGTELAQPGSASWAFEKVGNAFEAKTTVDISDEDGQKLEALMEALDELDDVQEVFTNAQGN